MPLHFSENELRQITEAVDAAEIKTAGEIVPVIARNSGQYGAAVWRAASLCGVLSLVGVMLVFQLYDGWGLTWLYAGWGVAVVATLAGTLGAVTTAYVPAVKRLLTPTDLMARKVHRRAMQAFVEEEVFDTKDRTGILIFISIDEHRIEVLGDVGINALVEPDDWIAVIERIREGIQQDRVAEGLVEAIGICGTMLRKRGVDPQGADPNELDNRLRVYPGD
ncbi:MAG: hypothetical protein GVY12_17610 [Bacteroidetes bacterium]|jgi:putative membrane protein|nr:hypothetical protein [Bacteroidota bacterium]